MMEFTLGLVALILAAIPAGLFVRNLRDYAPPPPPLDRKDGVSVLIPARNEARAIRAAVRSALASEHVAVEVLVLDDHSEDETAIIVDEEARQDSRVRLIAGPPLPPGWCGKQHACAVLAQHAKHRWFCFMDADVRLDPEALARLVASLANKEAALMSGFPRQQMETFLERLLLPFMHFLLLGYLPIARMRRDRRPAFGAGCGQLMLTRRDAYERSGGHAAIRASLHDGLTLPRAFRRAGLPTDLCDLTHVAHCRMYRSNSEVWRGLSKNATEGMAAPGRLVPFTILLLGGQVLPSVLLIVGLFGAVSWPAVSLAAVATALSYGPRLAACRRFHHPWTSAVLHAPGVLVLLALQWIAFIRRAVGLPQHWKGRAYDDRGVTRRIAERSSAQSEDTTRLGRVSR
jgi:GT2 family glycosyltransferase